MERTLPPEILQLLSSIVPHLTPMDALRTMVSALAETDPDVADMSPAANRRKATRLTGQMPAERSFGGSLATREWSSSI